MSRFPTLFIDSCGGEKISSLLAREIPLRYPGMCAFDAKGLIDFGAVYVNEKRCLEDLEVGPRHRMKVHIVPKRFPEVVHLNRSRIVFEDEFLVVVNKPFGVPIHATRDNLYENALEKMKSVLGVPLYVTHRLDTETQGLSIFAKTPDVQRQVNALFSFGQVQKFYQAGTSSMLPLGDVVHYTSFETTIPRIFSFHQETIAWKDCRLRILSCEKIDDLFISRIQLLTGRTHQIRGQLALMGHAIVGDPIYGVTTAVGDTICGGTTALDGPICGATTVVAALPQMQLICTEMNFILDGRRYQLSLS